MTYRYTSLVVIVASCSSPSKAPEDCQYTCTASGVPCPDGLDCIDGYCRIGAGETSCEVPDIDASIDAYEHCGFAAFPPTHLDACQASIEPDWIIVGNVSYSTTNGVGSGSPVGMRMQQTPIAPTEIRVIRVQTFSIS